MNGLCPNHPHAPATHTCERCRQAFCSDCLVPLKGRLVCGSCKHVELRSDFRVSGTVQAPAPLADTPCSLHPHTLASQVCERCGDFMCNLCSTAFEGRFYCIRCFDLLRQRGALGGANQQTLSDARVALGFGIFAFVPCVGIVLALIAAPLAGGVLVKTARQPDLPGRTLAIAALVVAILAFVSQALWIAFWIFGIRS